MSKFEFSVAIVSVVLALATTELIANWGRLIRRSERLSIDPIYAGWSMLALISALVHWGGLWAYESAAFNSQIELLIILFPALTLALAVAIFSPDAELTLSQREQYLRAVPRAFPLFGLFFVLAAVADYVVMGAGMNIIFVLACSGLVVATGYTKRIQIHVVVLAISWCIIAWFLAGGIGQWYASNMTN